ncbi:HEPN domain-containing protein [Zhaonella formicivorans]|uniref:HEPN domain-containing protein n=1 Tax=Zhaonella formicivorans TaxID=2528593 RepID=UPI0010EBE9C2|nr:HEPN domain-containing protein [Zhaonella formicivorans]
MSLSKWRLEKAQNTYKEGQHLLEIGLYNGAVNRFYYAAFHGIRALLATKKLDSPKHSGIIALFNKEFVKTGIMSKESSKIISKAFSERSHADYDDFKQFTCEEVLELSTEVNKLLLEIKEEIEKA